MPPTSHSLVAAVLATCLTACSSAPEESAASRAIERAASADSPTPAAPANRDKGEPAPPEGTLERRLFDAEQRYASGWERGSLRFAGELATGEKRSFMTLLRYGRCYRIVGAGGGEIGDLDLVLYDPAEIPVQRDMGEDPTPIIGLQAHLCPQQTATYRLEVKAFAGQGPFLVQVMESPN